MMSLAIWILFLLTRQMVESNSAPKCSVAPPPTDLQNSGPIGCGVADAKFANAASLIRIVGGTKSSPHAWPWQVSIRYNKKQFCGGTLLKIGDKQESDIVLTAAHCAVFRAENFLVHIDVKEMDVVLGNHKQSVDESGEVTMPLAKILVHENYANATIRDNFDVALVKLKCPVRFSKTIRPICLPGLNEIVPRNRDCMATGWGSISSSKKLELSDILQQAILQPLPSNDNKCKDWVRDGQFDDRTMFCAASGDKLQDTCKADSGGPLVCKISNRWVQYGITSFGPNPCAVSNKAGVFVQLPTFVSWIEAQIRKLTSLK